MFPGLEGNGFAHQWRAATCFLGEAPGADSSDWDESLREGTLFWGLCSPVQSPKPYPVLLPQFFSSVSNTPCKVMGLVLAFARGTS